MAFPEPLSSYDLGRSSFPLQIYLWPFIPEESHLQGCLYSDVGHPCSKALSAAQCWAVSTVAK